MTPEENYRSYLTNLFKNIEAWNLDELLETLKEASRENKLVFLEAETLEDEDGNIWNYEVVCDILSPEEYHLYLNSGGVNKYQNASIALEVLRSC